MKTRSSATCRGAPTNRRRMALREPRATSPLQVCPIPATARATPVPARNSMTCSSRPVGEACINKAPRWIRTAPTSAPESSRCIGNVMERSLSQVDAATKATSGTCVTTNSRVKRRSLHQPRRAVDLAHTRVTRGASSGLRRPASPVLDRHVDDEALLPVAVHHFNDRLRWAAMELRVSPDAEGPLTKHREDRD
jgi:hypothetical protein